jgi:glutaminase|tara:strand:+ start:1475 stop:1645 length:171 start_codon:yes stop_codon:yes gene_type:complete
MNSCGMSDYSGEFAYNIGLPSKSGIQGAMMIIIPGKMGVCVYSPLLDNSSNSVRGV